VKALAAPLAAAAAAREVIEGVNGFRDGRDDVAAREESAESGVSAAGLTETALCCRPGVPPLSDDISAGGREKSGARAAAGEGGLRELSA